MSYSFFTILDAFVVPSGGSNLQQLSAAKIATATAAAAAAACYCYRYCYSYYYYFYSY